MARFFRNGVEMTSEQFDMEATRKDKKLKRLGLRDRKTDCLKALPAWSVMDAHDERYRKLYGEKPPPVIEDLRSKDAAKTWPGYQRVQMPDGTWKEGPKRFRDRAEFETYKKTYGFVEY